MNLNEELKWLLKIVLVLIVHDIVQAKFYVLDSLAVFYGLEMHIPALNFLSFLIRIFPFSAGVSLM